MLFTLSLDNDTIPRVEDYNDMEPTLEGHTVSFSCPPGFVLMGPGSVVCTQNGVWEPDLRGITCNNATLEGQCTMLHKI